VSEARLILTCGLPGAGKTALASQVAADREAVRLTKDEWLTALGSSPWDGPTREKIERQLWHLAQEILRLGLSVVLDFGLWARSERDEMRSVARDLGVAVELTSSTYLRTNSGGASSAETRTRLGTAARSAGPTSMGGSPSSRRRTPLSSRCSILRQAESARKRISLQREFLSHPLGRVTSL